jgi:hypothetical protein
MTSLRPTICCWNCHHTFDVALAQMCDGCNPCDACRGARSVDEGCHFGNCGTHTLKCPSCDQCACERLEEWRERGRLRKVEGHQRFQFAHSDVVADFNVD